MPHCLFSVLLGAACTVSGALINYRWRWQLGDKASHTNGCLDLLWLIDMSSSSAYVTPFGSHGTTALRLMLFIYCLLLSLVILSADTH